MEKMEGSSLREPFDKTGTMDGAELQTTQDSFDKASTTAMVFFPTQLLTMKDFSVEGYSAERGCISGEKG